MLNKILLNIFIFFGVWYSSLYIKEKVIWFEVIHKSARVLLNPPTTYPPTTDHLPNDPRTTDQPPHRPNNHRPTNNIMFKRLENKTFFYRLQTQQEKRKTILRVIIYLNRIKVILRVIIYLNEIKVFDRMNNICLY